MATTTDALVDEGQVGVRLKISALWIAMLLLFAYGDIFGFLRADVIADVVAGEVGGIEVTQVFLVATALYIAVACAMVFLTLVLRPNVNRWVNVVLAALYIVSIAVSCIGEAWVYYYVTSAAEIALLLVLIRYAWTWRAPVASADR